MATTKGSSYFIGLLVILTLFELTQAFKCYSTLGATKKWNDDGFETECRLEAGFTKRKCIKFKTDTRPGKIIRDCDHVYEKLFSYYVMETTKKPDGCYELDAEVNGRPEHGVYCICSTELCNGGTVPDI